MTKAVDQQMMRATRAYEELQRLIQELQDNENSLRILLFMSHPCEGKYGDDGEMQCNRMPCIDFKRDTVRELNDRIPVHGILRMSDTITNKGNKKIE